MKKDIRNKDKQGNLHGIQINYYDNGNICWIRNFHHGLYLGYRVYFKSDKTIAYKEYWNMGKWVYDESYGNKQIQIKI